MSDEEKVDKVFRFSEIYNEAEQSLEVDTTYQSLTCEETRLTFQNFDFSTLNEWEFGATLKIKRVLKDDSDGDIGYFKTSINITKITSPAVPSERESKPLCAISEIEEIVFVNCIVSALSIDDRSSIKKITLKNSILEGRFEILKKDIECLNFSDSIFNSKVKIKECSKINEATFENTRFKDLVDFYKTHFYKIDFEKTTFEDISVFTETTFHEYVDFKYTTFNKLALFRKTVFEKTVNFEDSIFKEEANFLDVNANMANRETARIIKNSFEKQNNIIEANKFYALEMQEREKELNKLAKKGKNLTDWVVFKFHSISSDHSQSWFLALVWIAITTLLFTFWKAIDADQKVFEISFIAAEVGIISLIVMPKIQYLKQIVSSGLLVLLFINYSMATSSFLEEIVNVVDLKNENPITFSMLLFKVTIAYLMYQFIVSVRQNTRRK